MPVNTSPGTERKGCTQEELESAKKHNCPDCYPCQMCNDDKCKLCLLQRTGKSKKGNKFTVELFDHQIVFLYRLANDIRATAGVSIKRAEIIRALIGALEESGVDVTTAMSEADLKTMLISLMRR